MNKKFYFAPESEEILIETTALLAGSDVDDAGGPASDLGPLGPSDGQDPNED
jgi:hypothetical protein